MSMFQKRYKKLQESFKKVPRYVVPRKFQESSKKVPRKFKESSKKVTRKFQESPKKVPRKFQESPGQLKRDHPSQDIERKNGKAFS